MKRTTSTKRGLLNRLWLLEQEGSAKRLSEVAWSIIVILMLGFGIWVGHLVTAAYKDAEIDRLNNALDTAKEESLASKSETRFWQNTLKRLADGQQLDGKDIKRPGPNVED